MHPKTLLFSVLALAAVATTVAQTDGMETSPEFNIFITESSNSSLVGWVVQACHAGVTTEAMCISNDGTYKPSTTFRHRHRGGESAHERIGPLVWDLPVTGPGGGQKIESPMLVNYVPWSDVAVPMFKPGADFSPVGFDDDDKMFLAAYGDGSHGPPVEKDTAMDESHEMYNWYACHTAVGPYNVHAITWATVNPPQQADCESVTLERTFI